MASLFQQPTRRMVSASTRPHSNAMAPPARKLLALWAKPDVREESGGSAEQAGDVVAGDVVPAGAHKVGAQGGRWRKARGAEVLDSANEGLGGARHGVPAAAMSDDLATVPVLLGVKRQGTVGGTVQVRGGRGEQCKVGGTDQEGHSRQC